jgi:hypothetical protein
MLIAGDAACFQMAAQVPTSDPNWRASLLMRNQIQVTDQWLIVVVKRKNTEPYL